MSLEIDNIQLSDANALEQQPLEITLKQTFA
jgi:hypothetical protein